MTQKSMTKRLILSGLSLLAFASASTAQSNPTIVAQGFTYIGSFAQAGEPSHAYYLTPATGSWTAMETVAQSVGGHLVAVNSEKENEFIASKVGSTPELLTELFWIGMNKQTGVWAWSTGQAYDIANSEDFYHNWVSGQPDNSGTGQEYGVIHSDVDVSRRPVASWDDAHNYDVPGMTVKNNFRGIVEVAPCNFNVTATASLANIYVGYTATNTNLTATVSGAGNNALNYTWYGAPAGTLSCTTCVAPTFTPALTDGNYILTLVVNDETAGCAVVKEATVSVKDIRDGSTGKVWICHDGVSQSYNLTAAKNHIQNHPNDKLGKCPEVVAPTARREALNGGTVEVKVYPNPAQNAFFVEVPHTEEVASVVLLDVQGKVIDTRKVNVNDNRQVRFDLANSPRGLYIVEVSYGQERFHSKIVLQ